MIYRAGGTGMKINGFSSNFPFHVWLVYYAHKGFDKVIKFIDVVRDKTLPDQWGLIDKYCQCEKCQERRKKGWQ